MVRNKFINEEIEQALFVQGCINEDYERSLINLVNQIIREDKKGRYPLSSTNRMISKLSRFWALTRGNERYSNLIYRLDDYLDEVLSIQIPQRGDLKISLYFDDNGSESQEDVEEAALFHVHDGELNMFSGSIADVLVEMNSIL